MSLTGFCPRRAATRASSSRPFKNYGGERYKASIADDVAAKNFLYDGWIRLENAASSVANIEMDLNQVMSNGLTVIFGFQCDKWSGTWDYTANKGNGEFASVDACGPLSGLVRTPANWSQNAWCITCRSSTRAMTPAT